MSQANNQVLAITANTTGTWKTHPVQHAAVFFRQLPSCSTNDCWVSCQWYYWCRFEKATIPSQHPSTTSAKIPHQIQMIKATFLPMTIMHTEQNKLYNIPDQENLRLKMQNWKKIYPGANFHFHLCHWWQQHCCKPRRQNKGWDSKRVT